MSLGLTEILVIAAVILLLFGAKKIPDVARSLGRASYEFKKAKQDLIRESEAAEEAAEKKAAAEDRAASDGPKDA